MTRTIASYLRFFVAGLTKQGQTGALVPSQRFLVRRMISAVPTDYRGQVVELGAGTGALTLELARQCPLARVLACEINEDLAKSTRRHIAAAGLERRVTLLHEPAEQVLAGLRSNRKSRTDFIISGIPLGNLDRARSFELIRSVHETLQPGGMYIQFQYSLLDRKKIRKTFGRLRTIPAFLNLPPAVVYFAQKR
jgi:phosphatidylethanolamine/phosphatidyl-N-methylethanolamine N-methyltransferase